MPPRPWLRAAPRIATSVVLGLTTLSCSDGGSPGPTGPGTPAVATVEITGAPPSLELGDTTSLTAAVRDQAGNALPAQSVAWFSTDPAVISVAGSGRISALSAGDAEIVAAVGEVADTVAVTVHPWAIAEGVVVVDSAVMSLVSDSAQRAAGELHFDVLGGAPAPQIESGTILVGAQSGGFLRRVETVAVTGTRIATTTSDATLSDAIRYGALDASLGPDALAPVPAGVPAGEWSDPIVTWVAPGVTMAPGPAAAPGSWTLDADLCKAFGETLTCPVGYKLDLSNATVAFDPTVDLSAEWDDGTLKSAGVSFTGELELSGTVAVEVKNAWAVQAEATFAEVTRYFYGSIGPVPVVVTLTIELKQKFEIQVAGEVVAKFGVTGNASIDAGGTVTPAVSLVPDVAVELSAQGSAQSPEVSGKITISEKYSMTPGVALLLYGSLGPELQVGPFIEGKLELSGADLETCSLTGAFGLEGKLVFNILKLVSGIPKYEKPFDPVEWKESMDCPFGSVAVTVATSGGDPDPDGYTVSIGQRSLPIPNDGSVTFTGLAPLDHEVTLGGVANQCVVDENPKTASVSVGQTAPVSFLVDCAQSTGTLEVVTSTSGVPTGGGDYTVTVDGTQAQSIQPTGSVVFAGVATGDRSVELSGVPGNCSVTSPNPQSASMAEGQATTVTFEVFCQSNDLTVRAETSGEQLDPDGYTVIVNDGAFTQAVGINGSTVFGELSPGLHTVELGGVAANCAVSGSNPRSVQLEQGGSEVVFQVTCLAGGLVVDVATQGDPGVGSYTVTVDGSDSRTVLVNSSTLFSGLATGPHSVQLDGVPESCSVLGENPRNVDVPGSLAFSVDCTAGEAGMIAVIGRAPDDGQPAILTMNTDGLQRTVLLRVANVRDLGWSRDGSVIAYQVTEAGAADPQQLWVANADGSSPRKLASNNYALGFNDGWSPDGTEIAILWAESPTSPRGIYRVKLDGSGMSPVPNTSAVLLDGHLGAPSWSPDGSRLVFPCSARDVDPTPSTWNRGLCAVNVDGSGLRVVARHATDHLSPVWSPDGSRVAYFTTDYQEAAGGLWILRTDTWTTSQLSFSDERDPTWSPDGATLAFRRNLLTGGSSIYTIPSGGGATLRISTSDSDFNPTWRWR